MKKLIFALLAILFTITVNAQRRISIFEVPDKITEFGVTMPAGSIIYEVDSVKFYRLTARFADSLTMGDVFTAGSFTIINEEIDPIFAADSANILHWTDTSSLIATKQNIIDASLYQGVTWNSSTDVYTRLGSLTGIATSQSAGNDYLPIQSDMKRCLLADAGTVNYYIDVDNPINKDGTTSIRTDTTDGTTANKLVDSGADFVTLGIVAGQYVHNKTDDTYSIITAVDDLNTLSLLSDIMTTGEVYEIGTANYGGADGQVMVEIPKFYYKQTLVSTLNTWMISKYDLTGFTLHPAFWKDGQEVQYRYFSAFEGSLYDATTSAMVASANIATDMYASGDKLCSVAGTWPKTNETRQEYRAAALQRGTGFRQLDYTLHSAIQLLYLVEYANFNTQTMIGAGRTNLSGGSWVADSYIGQTGLSVKNGNTTASIQVGSTSGYLTDYMTYRGIENWYGNVWKMVDGITIDGRWTGSAAAMPMYYTNNAAYFADETSVNHKFLVNASYIGTTYGYITNIENAFGFIPKAVSGGSSTTYLTDYYYQYRASDRNYWRVFRAGGVADDGSRTGGFALNAASAWSYANVAVAGRLCF